MASSRKGRNVPPLFSLTDSPLLSSLPNFLTWSLPFAFFQQFPCCSGTSRCLQPARHRLTRLPMGNADKSR